jgi:hypothetical protein
LSDLELRGALEQSQEHQGGKASETPNNVAWRMINQNPGERVRGTKS